MSNTIEIQLGSSKNVNAINVDQNINIKLDSMQKELLSYNESSVIDVSRLFEAERQESEVYRVYGRIDFISIINGLSLQYEQIEDFFRVIRLGQENANTVKNITNSFDIYLCYPSSTNTEVTPTTFLRNYTIVSKLENIEIFKAGFSTNIYNNFIYAFDFNIDFNVEGYLDSFGKPINRFYLFFNYKPTVNGNSQPETVRRKAISGTNFTGNTSLPYTTYNVGDVVVGDFVNYINTEFEETLIDKMEYYVRFPYDVGALIFKYFPFIEIKVRDFDTEVSTGNISGGTETDITIPPYAIQIDNKGNCVWKEILQNGYIDPISGRGVDYPFVNKRHYIFNNITLPMKPDLNDPFTLSIFESINFGRENIFTRPSGDLNKLGNKCA